MNQVHVVIGKKRKSFSSMEQAVRAVRWPVLTERFLVVVCKAIFFS